MARVEFRESDHTYWLNGRQLISVTQLLEKHGLGADYSGIDPVVLKRAADRGTAVHKEIEDYIKKGEAGFTSELVDYIDITEQLAFEPEESEIVLPCGDFTEEQAQDIHFAGTADLIGFANKEVVLVDIKTTAKVDKRACAWQLSLYERLSGIVFKAFYVFHLGQKSKPVLIDRIPDVEIDRLLDCESKGEIYQEAGLVLSADLIELAQRAELTLKQAEVEKAKAEATAKEYRQILYEAMGKQNISSWETLDKSMLITRVAPSQKTTIDSKRLKKELPDIAEKYSTTSEVKGYIKITLREE